MLMASCLPSKGVCETWKHPCPLQWRSSSVTQPLLSSSLRHPVGCELCSWLQNWQTKTLSNWCRGKALPMLRASKLPSSCLQNTAKTQSTYIIYYSRIFSEKLQRKSQKRWWKHDRSPLMTLQNHIFPWNMGFYWISFTTKVCLVHDV